MNFFKSKTLGTQQREEHNIFSDSERIAKKRNESKLDKFMKSASKEEVLDLNYREAKQRVSNFNSGESVRKNIKSSKGFKVSGRGGFRL